MPKEKNQTQLCVDDLRHSEYYGIQKVFDELYAKSRASEYFIDLMGLILSRENILLAYRNIKTSTGSNTPGTDKLTIKRAYFMIQKTNLHYVIELDIKAFFDEVNHSKLIKQIWAIGIRDKHLIWILKQILKAPIKMPDGQIVRPTKGTPQGGIISLLLANIALDELDHWIESQWQEHPVTRKYWTGKNKGGSVIKSTGYRAMKNTRLKELYII